MSAAGEGGAPVRAALAGRLRDAARGVHWYLRELTGETAYDRYVEHVRAEHPGAPVMSRRDFERWRTRYREEHPGARCC